MNKVNFDSLKSVKAPEMWVQKAAAIPEAPVKKRAFPLYRAVAAASVVLVSAVGLLVFLIDGNKDVPVAVRSRSTEAVTISNVQETVGGSTTLMPTLSDPTVPPTDRITPTDRYSQVVTEVASAPTVGATAPAGTAASATQPTTAAPFATTPSGSETTAAPTDPPAQPTAPPATDPPATQEPTGGDIPLSETTISATAVFPASMLPENAETGGNDEVYCAVYDHGKLVSQGKVSVFVMSNGNVFAEYDTGVDAESGKTYHYAFFLSDKAVSADGYTGLLASGELNY